MLFVQCAKLGFMVALTMPYVYLTAGLAVLIISGNLLVTGSVQIARYFKISTLVVGLTVVAYGTSAPEMFISVGAVLSDAHDIALGNVIGSNIANIGCILAVAVLVFPVPVNNKSLIFDLLIMFLFTVLLVVFGFNGVFGRFEGIILVLLLICYTAWSVIKSRKKCAGEKIEPFTIKPWLAGLMILISIVGLYFSSGWFVNGAKEIALQWGISERIIAISVVAIGTSMPELIAMLVAGFRKETDLTIGNIIGSNLFNIAGVLGVSAIFRPLQISNQGLFFSDMLWVLSISIALVLTMIPLSKGTIRRWEGALLLGIFSVYMVKLFS